MCARGGRGRDSQETSSSGGGRGKEFCLHTPHHPSLSTQHPSPAHSLLRLRTSTPKPDFPPSPTTQTRRRPVQHTHTHTHTRGEDETKGKRKEKENRPVCSHGRYKRPLTQSLYSVHSVHPQSQTPASYDEWLVLNLVEETAPCGGGRGPFLEGFRFPNHGTGMYLRRHMSDSCFLRVNAKRMRK